MAGDTGVVGQVWGGELNGFHRPAKGGMKEGSGILPGNVLDEAEAPESAVAPAPHAHPGRSSCAQQQQLLLCASPPA